LDVAPDAFFQFIETSRFGLPRPEHCLMDILGGESARTPDNDPVAFFFPFQD
jgi:hypothetical protein